MSETNILAIFTPQASPEQFPASEKPDAGADTGFQRFLDDAVQKTSPAAENNKSDADPRNRSSQQTESTQKADRPSAPDNREANAAQEPLNKIDSAQNNRVERSARELASVDNYQQAVDHLKDLGFDTETIDLLLEFLASDSGANAAALLQSLVANLSPLNDNFLKNFLAGNTSEQNLLAQQQNRQGLVAGLLKQAGLTDQEAQDLIQKIQSFQTNSSNTKDSLTDKTRIAENTVRLPEVSSQAAGEAVKDSASKQKGGENSESKADIYNKIQAKANASEPADRKSSIDKLLTQETNRPQENGASEVDKKITFKNATIEKTVVQNNLQGINQTNGNASEGTANKGLETLKVSDYQIQNINAVSENGQKTAPSTVKAALPENPVYKTPIETRVIDQIVNRISLRSNGSKNVIKIRLDPPSLGTVRLNITTSGESVRAVIITENHAVKLIIENNLSQLRDSMNGQGLKMDGFTVLVGGESHPEFSGQNDHPNSSDSEFSDFMDPKEKPVVESEAEPVSLASFGLHGFSQVVNVFA
ncbi:MAG: flagellar hook-length control protein FliK [Nitrospinae bacterium]|nr:flagellar hook-length control protein FliK [Nitrospinota bacterium]